MSTENDWVEELHREAESLRAALKDERRDNERMRRQLGKPSPLIDLDKWVDETGRDGRSWETTRTGGRYVCMLREYGAPVHREYGATAEAAREAMASVIRHQAPSSAADGVTP